MKKKKAKIEEVSVYNTVTTNVPGSSTFRPDHYVDAWKLDPYTFCILNNVPFAEGNVIKYVMRWRTKDGIKDLMKARRVIDMLIEAQTNADEYLPRKTAL